MLFRLLISIHWGRKQPNEFVWRKLNLSRVQTKIVIARSLINVLFVLATREDGLQTISVPSLYVCGFYLWPSLFSRKIKQPGETEHMSNRKVKQARIDMRLSFGKWRRSRKRRVRGQSAPEKPPNSCHSTRHLAFATLLHDPMVIV